MSKSTKGIYVMLLTSVISSIVAVIIKSINSDVSTEVVLIVRYIIGIFIALGYMLYKKEKIELKSLKLLSIRGILGGLSMFAYYIGFQYSGLAKITMLVYTFPIFTFIFAFLFFKEKFNPWKFVSVIVAVFGIYLILRNDLSSINIFDLIALGSGIISGFSIHLVKELRKENGSLTILMFECIGGLVVVILGIAIQGNYNVIFKHLSFNMIMLIISLGLVGTLSNIWLNYVFKWVDAMKGSVILLNTVLLNFLAGIFIYSEYFTIISLIGSVILMGSIIYCLISKDKDEPITARSSKKSIKILKA